MKSTTLNKQWVEELFDIYFGAYYTGWDKNRSSRRKEI
jgi:hypothetical protein